MKWQYQKNYVNQSEKFRLVIENFYHIDEKKNVTDICEQVFNENINDWENVSVNRFYTNLLKEGN